MPARIMVVDDDEAGRYLLKSILDSRGYEVVQAADGVEALDLARQQPVDLVITDILMPNMDGYRMALQWTTDPDLPPAPFIFYTATYTDPADERFALDLGAERFLSKPADSQELLRVVGEVLGETSQTGSRPRVPHVVDEREVLREYSERLVNRLEHKVEELGEANIQLSGAHQALDAIIKATPLAVAEFNAEGRVTLWNPSAERIFGWTADEVIGNPNPTLPPELETEWPSMLAAALTHPIEDIRMTGVRKDGTRVETQLWIAPVESVDEPASRLVVVAQDTTERYAVERLKADFVSVVSHELRTPLTGIIGYSDLLLSGRATTSPHQTHEAATQIRAKAEELRQLVERLLEIASLQAGSLPLVLRRVDPGELARRAVGEYHVPPTHSVSILLDEGLPPLTCDPDRIGQAIQCLLSNAVKYSSEDSPIEVTVGASGDRVRISVTDHGVGIEPSQLESIFELFTQSDMSTTRSYGGTGIGLFVAKRLVEAHGGILDVRSVLGEGSTFVIDLAAART